MADSHGRTTPDTIVLIHGLWMTPLSWEQWVDRYTSRGYKVHAPSWPGMEGSIEDLRDDPSPIARLTIAEILDHYEKFIRNVDRPPIIMGHSFGGGFTQALLDRGLGAAGVAIDSAPSKGILRLPLSTLEGCLAGAAKPGEPPQGGGADAEAVPLRLHQHPLRRGVGEGV